MASQAQILANQANALKSTGPKTPEGKAASRYNALKHGLDSQSAIIPAEDPSEFEALAENYPQEFHPTSPSEIFHVDTMLRADWSKRRLQRMESDLYRTLLKDHPNLVEAVLSGSPAAKLLTRV